MSAAVKQLAAPSSTLQDVVNRGFDPVIVLRQMKYKLEAAMMECRRLILAGGCLAMLLHAALFGSLQRQHTTVVVAQFALRLGALWPAVYGYQTRSATALFAATAWGFVAVYCTYATCRVLRDPGAAMALDLWLPPVCLPYFRRYPLRLFFAFNLAEQVYLRKLFPGPVVVFMNMYYALLNSYAIWTRLPGTAASFWQVIAASTIWTVVAPFTIMQLIDRCWPSHSPTQHNSDALPNQARELEPSGSKQQQSAAVPAGAQTSSSAASSQTTEEDEDRLLFTYQAAVPRKQVVAKVYTPQGLSSLPPAMASMLQLELQGSMQVLGVAVRSGCICIKLDVGMLNGMGFPTDGCSALWDHLASVLLPVLQPMLHEELADMHSKQIIQIHVGDTVLSAMWDAAATSWQLLSETAYISLATRTSMSLGLAQQLGDPACSCDAHRKAGLNNGVAYGQAAMGQQLHVVHILAQVVAEEGATITTTQLAAIEGWMSPSSGRRHESVDQGTLRLMACCSGEYVSTVVLEVLEPAFGSTLATLKLALHVPDSLLPRHHAGGPPVGLLPVTLELCQGPLSCISSTPLLLQLPAGVDKHSHGSSCWWWGVSDRSMQQAIRDIQQAGKQQWQRFQGHKTVTETKRQYIGTSKAFLDDLTLWLNQIRCIAVISTGHCSTLPPACGLACTELQQPSLTSGQMELLGQHLLGYASKAKLHGLTRMLQQQRKVLHAWERASKELPHQLGVGVHTVGELRQLVPAGSCSAAAAAAAGVQRQPAADSCTGAGADAQQQQSAEPVPSKWRRHGKLLLDAVWGVPCPMCETKYRSEMARLMTNTQGLASAIFAVGLVVSMPRNNWLIPLVMVPYGTLHACIAALQLPRAYWWRPRTGTTASLSQGMHASSSKTAAVEAINSNGTNSNTPGQWPLLQHSYSSSRPGLASSLQQRIGISRKPHASRLQQPNHNSSQQQPPHLQSSSDSSKHITWICAVAHMWRVGSQYLLAALATKAALAWQINVGVYLINCLMFALSEQAHALLAYPARLAMVAALIDVGSVYAMLYRTDMLTLVMVPAAFMVVVLPRLVLEVYLRAMLVGNQRQAGLHSPPTTSAHHHV